MKRALVVYGGWSGHTPRDSVEVFIPLLRDAGFETRIAETLDAYLDAAALSATDLIVQCWTMGQITGDQWKGLCAAIENGTGFAGWHGGIIDSFRQNTDYQWMTGGQWVAHPGNCIPRYEVRVTDRNHEITRSIGDFTLTDTEQYYVHVDPAVHVLCQTVFSGEHEPRSHYPAGTVMPYAWTRSWGRGRVFVACWGHTYKDFDVPEAREIVRRGLLWAAR